MAPISEARADVHAFRALITTDTPMTMPVLNALWRWFLDVEIPLPIAAMTFTDDEHKNLTLDVLTELDKGFRTLEADAELNGDITDTETVATLNALWRELAGLYANMINDSIPEMPEEMRALFEDNALQMIADSNGIDTDDAAREIRDNPVARMMLRRTGIDPDIVLRRHNND